MISGSIKSRGVIKGNITSSGGVSGGLTAGVGGTSDYNDLDNKPSINGIVLEGDKTSHELDIPTFNDITPIVGYSTQELNTFTKWIDGKDIWRKTIISNSLPPSPRDWVILDTILNIDTVIKISTIGKNSYTNFSYTFPYITATYDNTSKTIKYYFDQMNTNGLIDLIVIVEYTKS